MTKDELEEEALKTGAYEYFDLEGDTVGIKMLLWLVNDALRKEREDCALLCEQFAMDMEQMPAWGSHTCADAIRARNKL
jgi:hypothetical protein